MQLPGQAHELELGLRRAFPVCGAPPFSLLPPQSAVFTTSRTNSTRAAPARAAAAVRAAMIILTTGTLTTGTRMVKDVPMATIATERTRMTRWHPRPLVKGKPQVNQARRVRNPRRTPGRYRIQEARVVERLRIRHQGPIRAYEMTHKCCGNRVQGPHCGTESVWQGSCQHDTSCLLF